MQMKIAHIALTALALWGATTVAAAPAAAQKTTQLAVGRGGSPHLRTDWTIGDAHISITYGAPYLKGRAEAAMMPAGKMWRTGADEATVLTTDKPLTFGTIKLAPGSYTINTVPGNPWQLVLGKLAKPGQWGIPYQPALELGRIPMTSGKAAPAKEQVTFTITPDKTGGALHVEWGTTEESVPFTIG